VYSIIRTLIITVQSHQYTWCTNTGRNFASILTSILGGKYGQENFSSRKFSTHKSSNVQIWIKVKIIWACICDRKVRTKREGDEADDGRYEVWKDERQPTSTTRLRWSDEVNQLHLDRRRWLSRPQSMKMADEDGRFAVQKKIRWLKLWVLFDWIH